MSPFRTKTLILPSGERLPLLLDEHGVPLHGPTVFAVAEIRGRHRAANTVLNGLADLSVLQRFLECSRISILDRLNSGDLLALGEVEAIVRLSGTDFSGRKGPVGKVSSSVCATRLRTIRRYLEWVVKERLLDEDYVHTELLARRSAHVFEAINARIPPTTKQDEAREGLPPDIAKYADEIVSGDESSSPWPSGHARVRNQLIWNMLRFLGVRGSELLGLRISRIDLRKGTLWITREPDRRDDPRPRQPNTKTLARVLALSPVLQRQLAEYILVHRHAIKPARKHDFLFVAASGKPLAYSSYNKIFRVLRAKHPDLPKALTGHVLRHTWNDLYSDEADAKALTEQVERETRAHQMGWNPNSNSAQVYTRRFIRRKAQEVSLNLQQRLVRRDTE